MGFTEIYERIKLATNCRTQVELAELLNIRQSSISDAKRRDSVPGDWYMKLFEHFGLNPDWLKYGVGPLYLRTDKGYCPQEAPQALAKTVACYGDDFTRSTVVDVYDMACIYTDEAPRPALSVSGRVPLPQAFLRPSLQVLRLPVQYRHLRCGRRRRRPCGPVHRARCRGQPFPLSCPARLEGRAFPRAPACPADALQPLHGLRQHHHGSG